MQRLMGGVDSNKAVMWRMEGWGRGATGSYPTEGRVMEGVDLCSHNGTSRCVRERWPCLKNIN